MLTLNQVSALSEDEARETIESILWPNGPVCAHCGATENVTRLQGEAHRAGVFQCNNCHDQFTVTVGTIFEDSHIPLRKWLVAWYLLCASKKGISSLQIQRMLRLGSYRTALFMMHRIRYALAQPAFTGMLKGVVEMDEIYLGGKGTAEKKQHCPNKTCVVSLVERGGKSRSMIFDRVTSENLKQCDHAARSDGSVVVTDDYFGYRKMPKIFTHKSVKHSRKEYVRKEEDFKVHTNTVESKFSLLKRGIIGTFHQVSKKHLPLYLAEFDHRFNERKLTDGERTVGAIKLAEGKRLTLKPLKNGKNSLR